MLFLLVLLVGKSASGESYTRSKRGIYVASRTPAAVPTTEQRAQATRDLAKRKATEPWVAPLEAGFLAGPIFSFGKGDPVKPGNTRNAFSFSLTLDRKLSDTFYLCPELGYVQRGVHTQLYSFSGFEVAGDVKLTYLEVPVLVKAKFPISKRLRTFLATGPNFGLALGREVEVAGLVEMDLTSRFSQYDFSFIFGGGAEYLITPELTFIGTARYTFGVVDIDLTDESSYKTRSLQILLGLRMPL